MSEKRHKLKFLIAAAGALSLVRAAAATTYTDAPNDVDGPNVNAGPEVDIYSVAVTNDASTVTFQVNLNPSANIATNYYANYEFGIQVGGGVGGQTLINNTYGTGTTTAGNPYGSQVGISTGENFFIGTYLAGPSYSGGAQLYQFSSTAGWNQVDATATINQVNTGTPSLSFSFTQADLGLSAGSTFTFDVWTTYSGGQGAYDALDNPLYASGAGVPYSGGTVPETPYDAATAVGSMFSGANYTIGDSLTWNNSGGGDGISWDTNNQNFNNGTGSTTFSSGANVTFDDNNNDNYSVTIGSLVTPGSVTVGNNSGTYIFSGIGGIGGSGVLTKSGTGNLTLSTVNSYTGNTYVTGGLLTLAVPGALPANANLFIGSGATVAAANHGTGPRILLQLSNFYNAGLLDLSNNDMLVHNGNLTSVTSEIAQGFNGGHWNGSSGITSTAAAATTNTGLGVELNSNGSGGTLLSIFDGQSVTSTDVLVKYTYFGDANLDGVVNGDDYTLIDNGFNNNLTGWHNGDFNYDGVVNGDDYTLIDNAFNTQGASLAAVPAASAEMIGSSTNSVAVPEPVALALAGLSAAQLLLRRRRRI